VAIKAQVHVGGRGKAGGIKLAENADEAEEYADDILGMDLKGYEVKRVLVEEAVDFVNELYVGVTMDRGEGEPVAMVSTKGGVDIEEVAEEDPEAIAREHRRPRLRHAPLPGPEGRLRRGRRPRSFARDVSSILQTLYDIWDDKDGSDAEINPLMITSDDEVIAADAVLNTDDDALFRHPDLVEMEEEGDFEEAPSRRRPTNTASTTSASTGTSASSVTVPAS